MPPERLAEVLRAARARLEARGAGTPGLDARLLLERAAGLSHAEIVAEPERPIDDGTIGHLNALLARREAGEPISRILGEREFYGRRFTIAPAVLDPRPDTETLIEAALPLMTGDGAILDLGTGSGIIAITLLAERPRWRATATDLSAEALAIATANARAQGFADRFSCIHGNWYEPVSGRFDLIVSNPPYIPLAEIEGLAREVRDHDPRRALDGGPDGLDAYRRIAAGAPSHMAAKARILVEIGKGQEGAVTAIFAGNGLSPGPCHRDLAGLIRCLVFHAS
ncbi:MAG: peptide chain release factor N(5)-glutamine methyltransferase [Alphaproteobacteria bacterium]|nr:peptide chain release factor N(5)-glutamine methyltransferase [Alphaproteobacteria bacterium]